MSFNEENNDVCPFDIARIEPVVARIDYRDHVGSTQDVALGAAVEGAAPLPLLVLARRQSAGRGRDAAQWWSSDGALTFSLVIDPDALGIGARQPGLLSAAVGLAVQEVIAPLVPRATCGLKWPNDVYLGGRKICGILVDIVSVAGMPDGRRLVVGVGINVNNSAADAPQAISMRMATLRDLRGVDSDLTQVLVDVIRGIFKEIRVAAESPDELIRRVRAVSLLRGREVSVRSGPREFSGICTDILPDGSLEILSAGERLSVSSGTVVNVTPPLE